MKKYLNPATEVHSFLSQNLLFSPSKGENIGGGGTGGYPGPGSGSGSGGGGDLQD